MARCVTGSMLSVTAAAEMSFTVAAVPVSELNRLRRDNRYEVVSLLTTCNEHFRRVSMHGVRLELLERQARPLDFDFGCARHCHRVLPGVDQSLRLGDAHQVV